MTENPQNQHPAPDGPGVLSRKQQDCIRFFWGHIFMALIAVFIAADQHFILHGASGWWNSLAYKVFIYSACLVGFVGNVWRAVQGWQLRSSLGRSHRH